MNVLVVYECTSVEQSILPQDFRCSSHGAMILKYRYCAGWLDRQRVGRLGQLHCLSFALRLRNRVYIIARTVAKREHRQPPLGAC